MKEYRKWLGKTWVKYSKILFIENVRPTFKYKKDLQPLMECQFRYPYLDNEIRYSDEISMLWKVNKKEAEAVLVHEMLHVVTDPFYAKANSRYTSKDELEDERERLVDHLANVVVRLVDTPTHTALY